MNGLIKKDLFMIANNKRTILITLAIYFFWAFTSNVDFSYFIQYMSLILCMSTFSYDDFNNWHSYAISTPNGRKNVVKSKYISFIFMMLVSTLIAILLATIIGTINKNLVFAEILIPIIASLFILSIVTSILFPILFKFGAEKGRIAILIITLFFVGIISVATKFISIDSLQSSASIIETVFKYVLPVLAVVSMFLSYLISKKIYIKKEF